MRISDWSSDVCSSDLDRTARAAGRQAAAVEQDERTARPQVAQAQRVGAGAAVGDEAAIKVVDLARTLRDGIALQRVGGAVEARLGDFPGGDPRARFFDRKFVPGNGRSGDGTRAR